MTNFSHSEFATSNGEFNVDLRALLTIQAYRSHAGDVVNVADGCRHDYSDSAHNIKYLPVESRGAYDADKRWLIIPATGYDITRKGMTTWELMDSVEDWIHEIAADYSRFAAFFDGDNLLGVDYPIFTGRGCYPDTNNNCIHLDMGHLSMNPVIRNRRTGVTRWIRTDIDRPLSKAGYHYANHFGESFSEMKKRLGL